MCEHTHKAQPKKRVRERNPPWMCEWINSADIDEKNENKYNIQKCLSTFFFVLPLLLLLLPLLLCKEKDSKQHKRAPRERETGGGKFIFFSHLIEAQI
jgi:hypothetical protein